MDKLIQDLKRHKENPPVIKYDKKTKRISVKYGFDYGFIPNVKIIAESKKWLQWFYNFEQQVTFDKIKSCLSRPPKKTLKALEQYVKDDPQGFTGEMLDCIQFALTQNPLYSPAVKTRRPSEYELTWAIRNEIANTAIRLYDYLYKISKQKEIDRPAYLKKFLNYYKIKKYNLKGLLHIQDIVRIVMSDYYGSDFKERFWQTFVIEGPISIKQVRKLSPNPDPENDNFLKELFKDFM